MEIKVFFEVHNGYTEQVAVFASEAVYAACLPALEALANELGFDSVTESVTYEQQNENSAHNHDEANDAFYAWERANNQQDLSDRDRLLWTAGWIQAKTARTTDEA